MKKPRILEYTNATTYLNSYSEYKKTEKLQWSKGAWAKHLGLKGTASLTMVLNGDRKPGSEMVEKFVHYFKFNKKEAQFFKYLVEYDKLKENDPKTYLIKKELQKLSSQKKYRFIHDEEFSYVSS